jgi:hypothetical protein
MYAYEPNGSSVHSLGLSHCSCPYLFEDLCMSYICHSNSGFIRCLQFVIGLFVMRHRQVVYLTACSSATGCVPSTLTCNNN